MGPVLANRSKHVVDIGRPDSSNRIVQRLHVDCEENEDLECEVRKTVLTCTPRLENSPRAARGKLGGDDDLSRCGHLSGLLARFRRPLALMESADRSHSSCRARSSDKASGCPGRGRAQLIIDPRAPLQSGAAAGAAAIWAQAMLGA